MRKDWFGFSGSGRSRNKQKLAFILIGLLACMSSLAQNASPTPDITALPEAPVRALTKNASGDQVQVGDRIPLDVEIKPEWIKGDSQFKLTVPEGSSKLTELGWYLDSNSLWISGNVRIVVSPLKGGRLTLPTLIVKSKDNDYVAIARTQPLSMNVITPEKSGEAKTELLDPEEIKLPRKFIFMALGLVALLSFLAYWLIKRLKRKTVPASTTPPVKVEEPEHVIATKRLDTLFQENPFSSEANKPIAFGVSEILKDFFSARFQVDASEATTGEMLALLRTIGMGSTELREISEFFDELDQIKFVKREHQQPFDQDTYQRIKTKGLAVVQRWARQITVSAPTPNRGPS